jgi:hypothetical protein
VTGHHLVRRDFARPLAASMIVQKVEVEHRRTLDYLAGKGLEYSQGLLVDVSCSAQLCSADEDHDFGRGTRLQHPRPDSLN